MHQYSSLEMGLVKDYLSSSTIHGLSFIGSTKSFIRLLWIFIVIFAFSSAALLIKSAFQTWSEAPIKTTIETLDIMELKLPKVTVCPPKDTFTTLNYDIARNSIKTLTKEIREDLISYALQIIQDEKFEGTLENELALSGEDMFYDWYHGNIEVDLNSESIGYWHEDGSYYYYDENDLESYLNESRTNSFIRYDQRIFLGIKSC